MEKTGLTGGTGVNVTSEKRIPKKKKYIKPKSLSQFLPGNKWLLNEDSDDNTETTDTSISGKIICHILVQMILMRKKWQNNYK